MIEPPATIQEDFDRIAQIYQNRWTQNSHYYDFLLSQVPPCRNALDIGCGTGAFSRLLAGRCDRVLALDLSPQMIRIAKERSQDYPNIDYRTADVMERPLAEDSFDCIAAIATLHHLPLEEILQRMEKSLKAGGTIVVLDLYKTANVADLVAAGAALPADLFMRLIRSGRLRESRAAREAWAMHARHDHYLALTQIRKVCAKILPGARMRRHLFWRYSIVWKKQAG